MRAGSGIVHSERTGEARKRNGQRLSGLQTWVALPREVEEADPDFIHLAGDALPVVAAEGVRARLIAGSAFGERSPLATPSETLYADVMLDHGARLEIEANVDERALYITDGAIRIGSDRFEAGQLVVLRRSVPIVIAADGATRAMLFGGEPMGEARYIWWNFVSSRPERIEQAKAEWRSGQFDTVPGDAEAFIPLPESIGEPKRAQGGVRYP